MHRHHHFNYSRVAELRKTYVPDSAVLDMVKPTDRDIIVDIGAGEGHYSALFASRGAKVYAIDISEEAMALIEKKAAAISVKNVNALNEDVCSSFSPQGFNKVFFGSSFHDLKCREDLIQTLLQKGTHDLRVVILEFKKAETVGPPVEIRISEEELDRMMEKAGLRKEAAKDLSIHYIHSYKRA